MLFLHLEWLLIEYGASGSQTDVLDRIASIFDGSTTLVTYDYQGSGQMITQTYNQPGIEKDYVLDRFGRMEELNWAKGQTDLVDFRYGYDRNSNRLFERNQKSNAYSHLFVYDQLNRMTSFQAGSLNSGNTAISSPAIDQSFTLDETGNFTDFNESGSSVSTLNQTRVHDTVNEITNISQSSGTAWATPNHDANGNMTVIPNVVDSVPESSFTATWDAWNRLIKLADDGDTVASYQYDGNNRRIVVQKFAAGSAIEDRHVYYSSASQALEERVDTASTADTQFVWSLGYVDDLMLRDQGIERLYALNDLRFSIVALANTSGTIVERYDYGGHGVATVLDSAFVERPNRTSHDWQFRYTGRRQDLETGLYYFRARCFHAQLGRFISRDPLGFVDGMSLYRAYFVPGGLDSTGLVREARCCCCVDDFRQVVIPFDIAVAVGHSILTSIELSYEEKDQNNDCTLEWWEWTDVEIHDGMNLREWTNLVSCLPLQIPLASGANVTRSAQECLPFLTTTVLT